MLTHEPIAAPAAWHAPQEITGAIRVAARRTGADFAYLMDQAKAESSFRADARAQTSSATGLYQFIDQTWLNTVRDHGAKHGLAREAASIDAQGRVADPQMREDILALRKDPKIAALMAGEFAGDNRRVLESRLDMEIGSTELYFAHFLGAGGASRFLSAMQQDPGASAADLFPAAARANRAVFYDQERPRSLAEVHGFFADKFSASQTRAIAVTSVPAAQPVPPRHSPSMTLPAPSLGVIGPPPGSPSALSGGLISDLTLRTLALLQADPTAEDHSTRAKL